MAPPGRERWRWRYTPRAGVLYGPIPVGILLAATLAGVYFFSR
jgi:hypothetical protein